MDIFAAMLTGEEVDLGGVIGVPDADDCVVAAGHDEAVVHVHRRRHVRPGRNLLSQIQVTYSTEAEQTAHTPCKF